MTMLSEKTREKCKDCGRTVEVLSTAETPPVPPAQEPEAKATEVTPTA
jgi:hypothetical protein